jgi:hypothetical protein
MLSKAGLYICCSCAFRVGIGLKCFVKDCDCIVPVGPQSYCMHELLHKKSCIGCNGTYCIPCYDEHLCSKCKDCKYWPKTKLPGGCEFGDRYSLMNHLKSCYECGQCNQVKDCKLTIPRPSKDDKKCELVQVNICCDCRETSIILQELKNPLVRHTHPERHISCACGEELCFDHHDSYLTLKIKFLRLKSGNHSPFYDNLDTPVKIYTVLKPPFTGVIRSWFRLCSFLCCDCFTKYSVHHETFAHGISQVINYIRPLVELIKSYYTIVSTTAFKLEAQRTLQKCKVPSCLQEYCPYHHSGYRHQRDRCPNHQV